MANENKLKPEPDTVYKINKSTGFFKIVEYRDHDMMCAPKDE